MLDNLFAPMSEKLRDRIVSEGYSIPECTSFIKERIKQIEGVEFNPPETKVQTICKHWPYMAIGDNPQSGKRIMVFGKTVRIIESEMSKAGIESCILISLRDMHNCEYKVGKY